MKYLFFCVLSMSTCIILQLLNKFFKWGDELNDKLDPRAINKSQLYFFILLIVSSLYI